MGRGQGVTPLTTFNRKGERIMENPTEENKSCDGTHCHTLAMRVGFAVIVDQLNSLLKTITTVRDEAQAAYEKEAGRPYPYKEPSQITERESYADQG